MKRLHTVISDSETTEFAFDCSNVTGVNYTIYLPDDADYSEELDSMDFVLELFGLNEAISSVISVDPPNYTANISALYKAIWFTITFTEGGQTSTCKFQRTVLREYTVTSCTYSHCLVGINTCRHKYNNIEITKGVQPSL